MCSKVRANHKATIKEVARERLRRRVALAQLADRGIGSSALTKTMVNRHYKAMLKL